MRTNQPLTITLTPEMAKLVKAKVSSGEYATESDVIGDGLRSLAARDAIEKWLREDVVSTYDEMKAHPERAIALDEAFAGFKDRIDSLVAKPGK